MKELHQKMKLLSLENHFSIEIDKNSMIFFCLTRECESSYIDQYHEFRKIIESSLGEKLEELTVNDVEKCFWDRFYKNFNFSNIGLKEKSYEFKIKDRIAYLAIFSVKNSAILTNILDLIASLKMKEFRLYFNINLESNIEINLSIESESIDKISEFYLIISKNFPRECISLFLPSKSLFIQYLFKFLCLNHASLKKSPRFQNFLPRKKFLKKLDFKEVRPHVFVHRKKPISVVILRKINLRFVKYYLKTYYPKYFLVFWVLNTNLIKILKKNTKIQSLRNCSVQNKIIDTQIWEKVEQIELENS